MVLHDKLKGLIPDDSKFKTIALSTMVLSYLPLVSYCTSYIKCTCPEWCVVTYDMFMYTFLPSCPFLVVQPRLERCHSQTPKQYLHGAVDEQGDGHDAHVRIALEDDLNQRDACGQTRCETAGGHLKWRSMKWRSGT